MRWPPERIPFPPTSLLDRLAPYRSRLSRRAEVPWGWREWRELDRGVLRLVPLWLYWPLYAWRFRWNLALEPLIRIGILVGPEGGWLWDFRPWFWTDERERSWRAMWRGLPDLSE